MLQIIEIAQYSSLIMDLRERLEKWSSKMRKKYIDRLKKYQQLTDISFLGAYLTSTILDGVFTLQNIESHNEEAHKFTSFMMESYGIDEGLLRTQGIEALQLAALLGLSYIIVELWKFYKGEQIDIEIRFAFVYVYMAIGISKHIQGILSWL
jgi:hypothetical protein